MSTDSAPLDSEPEPEMHNDDNPSLAQSSGLQAWHIAGLLLVVAVVGLGLYGLWPMITGQGAEDAAQEDVEAPSSEAAIDVVVADRVDFPLRTQATGHLVPWQTATLRAEAGGQVTERAVQ